MSSAAQWVGIIVSFSVGVVGIILAVRAQNHAKRIDGRTIERHEVQRSVEFDRCLHRRLFADCTRCPNWARSSTSWTSRKMRSRHQASSTSRCKLTSPLDVRLPGYHGTPPRCVLQCGIWPSVVDDGVAILERSSDS